MAKADIEAFKSDWCNAVSRAIAVGFDIIEIHAGHGHFLNSFLSPATNQRNDEYGGPFENRIRLIVEVVDLTRQLIPEDYPLMIRMPETDYLYYNELLEQCHIEDAVKLARVLAEKGVDFLDITGGGLDPRQKIDVQPGYQVQWAAEVKKAVAGTSTVVSGVGSINSALQAQGYIQQGDVDAVMVGRAFLKNPGLVWQWADELGIETHVASQPVPPWFFTHFNIKSWAFICEDQSTLRWELMLVMKPELIEILTWNDFGESHYISGPEPHHSADGSSQWATGYSDDARRTLMKPYIAAYKAGAAAPTVDRDTLVYWYRTTPTCNDPLGRLRGVELFNDVVGMRAPVTVTASGHPHLNFTMGLGEQKFKLTRGGVQITGGFGGK